MGVRTMSSVLDQLGSLVSDGVGQLEYKHELAVSAFTNDIALRMQEQGVSQSDLARLLDVSRARVSQLMQHVSSPTLRTMVEVAHALGCDVTPGVAPCGFRPARLYVADGGKNIATYRETKRLSESLGERPVKREMVAV